MITHDMLFFSYARAPKTGGYEMTPVAYRKSDIGVISNIFKQTIHRFR